MPRRRPSSPPDPPALLLPPSPLAILALTLALLPSALASSLPQPTQPPAPSHNPVAAPPLPLHLPLHRQNGHLAHLSRLHKREHKEDVVRAWALREKGRLGEKYGASEERLRRRDLERKAEQADEGEAGRARRRRKRKDEEERLGREKRQIIGVPPSSSSSSRVSFATAGVGGSSSSSASQEYAPTTTWAAGSGYGSGAGSGTATGTAGRASETLPVGLVHTLNYDADLSYYAPVGIGVPAQYMNCILDTGSADLWFASSLCASNSSSDDSSSSSSTGCALTTPLYNTTLSRTSLDMNTSFSVRYGSGSAQGDIWQDYVSFAGYNVSSQGFALVEEVSEGLLSGEISGLMGLGWQPLAASRVTPFWQNLYAASALPFPGFGVSLSRFIDVPDASAIEPGGSLTFGYLNASLYAGEINYVPIPAGAESYWVVRMDQVAVNGTNVTAWGRNDAEMVAIDTGTTLIGGSAASVRAVYAQVEGARAATGAYSGYYSYPCDVNVSVALTFGGISYNMSHVDFNLGPFGVDSLTNRSTCLGAFFELSFGSGSRIEWVIGAAFLKNVYTTFRASPPSVGFALPPNSSSTRLPSFPSNSSDPARDMTDGNLTAIPGGIYGPSGGVSVRTTLVAANTVTTAVQAGGTVGRTTSGGCRSVEGGKGWGTGLLATLMGAAGAAALAL
ncbi:hypothetical protein JCM10213_000942 [Rhodosporidiobolus nylandii]